MLTELHIEDLGVIAALDLVFGPGLTALTGETGAGKTMLVEAINLLVGGRADASIVRPGAAEARVEGRFVDGDDEYVLARVIPTEGRSRAYLNGRLATVASLADVGARFVDLHGQHTHQSLLGVATQRAALDRFGSVDLGPLRAARARLTEIDAALASLGGDARTRARELDLLRFQVAEIRSAELDNPAEEADLDALEDVLAGAVAHRDAAQLAVVAVTEDDGSLDRLGAALAALHGRAPFEALSGRLRGVIAELDDIVADLRHAADSIEEDPERLAVVRERRQLLRDLRRKYGDTLAEVIEFFATTVERLDELESYDQRADALERERVAALQAEATAARAVGAARRAAAPRLAAAVEGHLRQLAMAHADVAVEVGPDPGDDVSFMLAANPGSPLLPLTKVASGGELARSMLALRLVLSEEPSTLVFDEVDAGIGGDAAVTVGRALANLGERHQVLVVTHLAQVAASATTQVVVSKRISGGETFASARPVFGEQRVDEVARMLSGSDATESARTHAVELIDRGRVRG
ncbi:MAG TPA: DNA repair protein RecN [Ilumatobacteraceae bacterium]